MSLKLYIDYRERDIIKLIDKDKDKSEVLECDSKNDKDKIECKWENVNMKIEISNLPVADFVFSNGSEHLILVERKTVSDLESSITDGRFRQQKSRLIDSIGDPRKILYIIEGNKEPRKQNIVNGSIINMIYKHEFKLLFTKSHRETLTFLSIIYKKLQNGDIRLDDINKKLQNDDIKLDDINNENQNNMINNIINDNNSDVDENNKQAQTDAISTYTSSPIYTSSPFKLLSKSDDIKQKLFQCLLSVIPGVSMSMSNKIVEIYPTLKVLMDTYRDADDDKQREQLLCNINIGSRKLGKVLSKKIWKTFYFNSVE